jgi:hypothetical protein
MNFSFRSVTNKSNQESEKHCESLQNSNKCKDKQQNAKTEIHEDRFQENQNMVCLSNLEEIVFYTQSSKCLLKEMKLYKEQQTPVDYDKYLDFFE